MKKIQNKFVQSQKTNWNLDDFIKGLPPDYYDNINFEDYTKAHIETSDQFLIRAFPYRDGKKIIVIPEPEPSIMFIRNAQSKLDLISKFKHLVIQSASTKNTPVREIQNNFSLYFNLTFDFLINLFSSIEAFNNSLIPEKYTFRKKRKLYDRSSIQRFIDFKTKIEIIIPEIKEKSFIIHHEKDYAIILDLKATRDNLIHTKNQSLNWETSYRDIYKKIMYLDYKLLYQSVKNYMNFYQENWVE